MAKVTDLYVNIGAKTDGLKKGLGDAENQVKGFSSSIGKLGGLIAGAFSLSVISAFVGQCSQLAMGADEITHAFKRLNEPGLLANLRKATEGTVIDLNLMKSAIRAESLGIPIKQLGTYFEFAKRQAGALGMSAEQVTDAIVNGIGNKATRAFRQLGISSIEVNKAFADIQPELLSVEEVAARAFLMINTKLKEMGPNIDFDTDAIERQTAAWENLKIKIGGHINALKAAWAPLITRIIEGSGVVPTPELMNKAPNAFDLWNAKNEKEQKDAAERAASQVIWEGKAARAVEDAEKKKKKAIEDSKKTLEDYNKLIQDTEGKLPKAWGGYVKEKGETAPETGGFGTPDLYAGITSLSKTFMDDYIDKGNKISDLNDTLSKGFEDLGTSIVGAFGNIENIKDFGNALKNTAKEVILTIIAQTMAENMAKAGRGSKTWWGAIAQAALASSATAAVFKMIPSFAQGGIVQGKQMAMVGDNPSGVEAIIPKEQWGKMGQNVNIQGIVRGKDLYWVMKNYSDHLQRTT